MSAYTGAPPTRQEIAKAVFYLRQLARIEDGGVHRDEILGLADKINLLQWHVPLVREEEPPEEAVIGYRCANCWIYGAVCLAGLEADMGLCCDGCSHDESLAAFYADPANRTLEGRPVRRKGRGS